MGGTVIPIKKSQFQPSCQGHILLKSNEMPHSIQLISQGE